MSVESDNDVHKKESYPHKDGVSAADRYAKNANLNWDLCANDYVIDVNKRGKVKDVTNKEGFKLEEPAMTKE